MIPVFIDTVRSRKSCRLFTDEPLDRDEVDLIMEAGLKAPSSRRLDDVRLFPVADIPTIRRLAGCKASSTTPLETATFAVVVAADPAVCDVWIEDASIASIMMQLEGEELGIGSCWVQVRLRDNAGTPAQDIVRDVMGIDPSLEVLCVIAFGRRVRS